VTGLIAATAFLLSVPALAFAAEATSSGEKVSQVRLDRAILEAKINPNGSPASYFFEYGTSTSYGEATLEEAIGDGENPLPVSQSLTGLTPGTTYHWRVVMNSLGESHGPDRTFTTQLQPSPPETGCANQVFREFAGAALPDCRAYEQASPADKNGLNVEGFMDILAASSDGSKVSFYSQAGSGIPAAGGAHQEFTTLLSSRIGESWSTQRLLPPEELGTRAASIGTSQDLRYALVETARIQDGEPRSGLFIIDAADSSVRQIVPYESQGGGFGGGLEEYAYDGISTDGSRVFFETWNHLTDDASGLDNLYMWDRDTGKVSLVGVLPGASEEGPVGGSFGGAYSWFFEPTTSRGGSLAGLYVEALHAISPAGDQAYFTAGETGQLYLRRGLAGSNPSTIHVSAPEVGVDDPHGPRPAAFQEATPDGSRAFFLSSEKLTADATSGALDEGEDLYRYDEKSEALVDVTPDPTDPNGAEVRGLLGASADGSSGYFVAKGLLASGGTLGNDNLYGFEEDGGNFTITFVANLGIGAQSITRGIARNWSPESSFGPIIDPEGFTSKTSRVSPDGQTLLFRNQEELYLYSAKDTSLKCISCIPTGEQSIGPAQISTEVLDANLIPRSVTGGKLTRNLSADGSRVFFQTPNSLVAADENNVGGCKVTFGAPDCLDVYEWEAPGAPGGSCHEAEVNGGCLYLLSTGKSKDASYLIDASTDGMSSFIATSSQLVPTDKDELHDIYGVRTNGGLASQHFTSPTPCSSGEACHGPSSKALDMSSPGTSSFQGPGNPKSGETKAKKCKRSAHNKCAKRRHKKHRKKKSAKRPTVTTRKVGGSK
jgi:hypothetical protein